ncbi:MAG TPA: hypothetical protein VLX91_13290 [Candidatus Acidoferrales bacterium]|nr:hypothetical protein [Candidatus Acidoferrales bacterium]
MKKLMKPITATVFGSRNGTWVIPDTDDQTELKHDCENDGAAYIVGNTAYHAIYLPGAYQNHGRTVYYVGQLNNGHELMGKWIEIDRDELPTEIAEALNV